MLWYFPRIYPDEILYSAIARYHYHSGNTNKKTTMEDLFDDPNITANLILPRNLDILTKKIGNDVYSSEYIIQNHTLLPYYLPFLPSDMQEAVLTGVTKEDLVGLYTQVGLSAASVCDKEELYYCPLCVKEDVEKYGESYFRRIHQIPGIITCNRHQCLLQAYPDSRLRANRHQLIRLEHNRIRDTVVERIEIGNEDYNYYNTVRFLLDNKLDLISLSILKKQYKMYLNCKGYTTAHGRFKRKMFKKAIHRFYGHEVLEKYESNFDPDNNYTWIDSLINDRLRAIHPIRQILVSYFLTNHTHSLYISNALESSPFDDGPWPCLNPVAPHYHENVVKYCDLSRSDDGVNFVGTFYCSCGFVYSRTGPDVTSEDKYRIGRIKDFGHLWRVILEKNLSENLSFREIARRMKCDTNTVINQSLKLEKNETLAICKLKYIQKKEIGAEKFVRSEVNPRVDWDQRDSNVLVNAKEGHSILMKSYPTHRVTKYRITRKSSMFKHLQNEIDKLPRTKAFIESVVETQEEYKIRYAKTLCRKRIREGIDFRPWQIYKEINLRKGSIAEVDMIINVYYVMQEFREAKC